MGRQVVFQHESGFVDVQSVFVFEDGGRNRTRRRGWESELKVSSDERGLGKMFARVFVRQDTGSGFMDPLVATGMVEMPVGVDQLFDRIRVDARESFRDVWTCGDDLCIHHQLSVRACQNGDISTSAQKDTDIASKVLNRDLCRCSFLERTRNDATCLGDQVSRGKAGSGDCEASSSKKLTA